MILVDPLSKPEAAVVFAENLDLFDDQDSGSGKVAEQVVTLTFTATGTVGAEHASITLTSTATLTLRNPCFDPCKVKFTIKEEMRGITYVIPKDILTPPSEYCCYDGADGQFTLNVPGPDPGLCGIAKIEFFYDDSTHPITNDSTPLSIMGGEEQLTL